MRRWCLWFLVLSLACVTAPARAEDANQRSEFDFRPISAFGLLGAYVGLGAWTWLAWYRDRPTLPHWTYAGDGAFASDSYAGGADKLGHAWSTHALTRLSADLLEAGGWSELAASSIAAGLCTAAFTMIEVNDGNYTEFSPGDLAADVIGVGAALAIRHVPRVDEAFDFRVQWFPSRDFRLSPSARFAEDYSGQTYLLALKLGVFDAIRQSEQGLQALQFVNPVVAFETRGYVPEPAEGRRVTQRQSAFLGLTLDLQAILDLALAEATSPMARVSRAIGHGVFEYVNAPYSTLSVFEASRETQFGVPDG